MDHLRYNTLLWSFICFTFPSDLTACTLPLSITISSTALFSRKVPPYSALSLKCAWKRFNGKHESNVAKRCKTWTNWDSILGMQQDHNILQDRLFLDLFYTSCKSVNVFINTTQRLEAEKHWNQNYFQRSPREKSFICMKRTICELPTGNLTWQIPAVVPRAHTGGTSMDWTGGGTKTRSTTWSGSGFPNRAGPGN